jgi:sodium transport system permease protein
MSRFSRINTIWRKELIDLLRDRRTVIAMVLVPMALYPALMLGSLQALEVQQALLGTEVYNVAVESRPAQLWTQQVIQEDASLLARSAPDAQPAAPDATQQRGARPRSDQRPPPFRVFVVPDIEAAVRAGDVHVALRFHGEPPDRLAPPALDSLGIELIYDGSDVRSRDFAGPGLSGILQRHGETLVRERLRAHNLPERFVQPVAIAERNIAPPERMSGAVLGQIVPLILIVMTITGAIYPAIDLTAGERERGTLETLVVAPVPTIELIVGKFIVVTLIGLLSAVLNLASIGGTIYLGGVGDTLTRGGEFVFPLTALPLIFLLLVPLSVMFSAILLAVCSFARSFKEAQNYVVPVMMAALIPAVVGILPGTRLEGPIVVMPVANIVVLTRDLFLGRFDYAAIAWVLLSTSLYGAAAIAVAARLFGQEAVLFADAGSLKTLFQRRFFVPLRAPSAATALLMLALAYTLNFYLQQALARSGLNTEALLIGLAAILALMYGLGPWAAARYLRINVPSAFALSPPPAAGWAAAALLGCSTWILTIGYVVFQSQHFPMDSAVQRHAQDFERELNGLSPVLVVLTLGLIPAFVEEWFFRGFVLSGLRSGLGKLPAVLIVALAFGLNHYSAHRIVQTTALGLLLGMLAVQYRSIWPAVLAHALHNGITVVSRRPDGLQPLLDSLGFVLDEQAGVPAAWLIGAGALCAAGVVLALLQRPERTEARP